MPKPSIKTTEPLYVTSPPAPPLRSVVAIGDQPLEWAASPARLLHDRLVTSFVAPPARHETVLPAQTRLAIVVGSSAFLWLVIGVAARAIL